MVKKSMKWSRRTLLLSGSAVTVLGPYSSKAQVLGGGGLGDFNFSTPVDILDEAAVATGRQWDAIAEYVKDDTALLAPKVEEFIPADPPMPHMKSTAELEASDAVFEADLERSNETGKFQAVGKPNNFLNSNGKNFPNGFILNIPPGEYALKNATYIARQGKGFNYGPRFIFRGQLGPNGERPVVTVEGAAISVKDHGDLDNQNSFAGLEVKDIELKSPNVGVDAGPGAFLRYYRFDNVLFSEGFKNGNHPSNWPGVGIYNNCTFARSGRGDGFTHTFYGSYVQSLIFRNCLFTSPRRQAHPIKCYAQSIDMRGCTIANWWHEEDLEEEYYGEQAPADMGAWGQSYIQGCHFIRRGVLGKTRTKPFIDFRNRIFEAGFNKYRPADFGADGTTVDYHDIDNEVGTDNETDPADPMLFRHVLLDNKFFNGILPDGGLDAEIERRPGYLFRNNGTIYSWANGEGALTKADPGFQSTPTDYTLRNERSVLYVRNSELTGVPVQELYPGPPNHESDPHPVVELGATLPGWIMERMTRTTAEDYWWETAWPSTYGPQL